MLMLTQLAGLGGGVANLSALTQPLSATSVASTITAPTGIQAGDIIVLFDSAQNLSTIPATVVPTGFTSIINAPSSLSHREIISFKLADGTEGGTTITGMNGATSNRKVIFVFRGDIAITTVTPANAGNVTTSGNPASTLVTSSAGIAPLVVLAGWAIPNADGSVDNRSFNPAKDAELNPSPSTSAYFAYKIYNSAPADITVDMDDEGVDNQYVFCYLQVA